MRIIPLDTYITRDVKTGKKLYNGNIDPKRELGQLSDSLTSKFPDLSLTEARDEMAALPGYAIIPGDNLIVIDIDDKEPYDSIVDMLGYPEDDYTFAVPSDKGYAHYLFTPTEYFNKSKLKHTSRKKAKGVDILQGKCFTWGYGALNETKRHPEDITIADAIPIPDVLVDYLVDNIATKVKSTQVGDNNYNQLYIGKELIKAISEAKEYLTHYKDPDLGRAWEFFEDIAEYITPNRFKEDMTPDLFPDSLPHTVDSATFIQATVSKLLRDPSIEDKVIIDLLSLITGTFWSVPITYEDMMSKLSNLTTQSFSGISYSYDEKLLTQPLVGINKGGFGRVFVDVNGNYHVETLIQLVNMGTHKRFRMNIQTKGNKFSNKKLIDKNEENLVKELDLISPIEDITKPKGLIDVGGEIKLYNNYNKTVFHNIVMGTEQEPSASKEEFPTFIALLKNLTYDHAEYEGEQERIIDNFLFFLSQKMKKMIYSPLIFQLNGKGGVGKGVFVDTLSNLTGGKFKFNLAKSNKHFNSLSANIMWGQQSEIPVNEENKEELKAISGDRETVLEAKGVDEIKVANIRTDFVETNNDKVFEDPRRFVLWQSFGAPDWDYNRTISDLVLELRRLCAYLRDIDPRGYNKGILTHSRFWNGRLLEDTKLDREESFGYGEDTQLVTLLGRYKDLTGNEINDRLVGILGEGYWHELKVPTSQLWIILYTPGATKLGGEECTHKITVSKLKKLGIKTQRITSKQTYSKAVHRVTMELTPVQLEGFKSLEQEVEPIED